MALKDKLMTLEDFKAVRDVDVASNSAQFTEIKADLDNLAESEIIQSIAGLKLLDGYDESALEVVRCIKDVEISVIPRTATPGELPIFHITICANTETYPKRITLVTDDGRSAAMVFGDSDTGEISITENSNINKVKITFDWNSFAGNYNQTYANSKIELAGVTTHGALIHNNSDRIDNGKHTIDNVVEIGEAVDTVAIPSRYIIFEGTIIEWANHDNAVIKYYQIRKGETVVFAGNGVKLTTSYPLVIFASNYTPGTIGKIVKYGSTTATDYKFVYTAEEDGYVIISVRTDAGYGELKLYKPFDSSGLLKPEKGATFDTVMTGTAYASTYMDGSNKIIAGPSSMTLTKYAVTAGKLYRLKGTWARLNYDIYPFACFAYAEYEGTPPLQCNLAVVPAGHTATPSLYDVLFAPLYSGYLYVSKHADYPGLTVYEGTDYRQDSELINTLTDTVKTYPVKMQLFGDSITDDSWRDDGTWATVFENYFPQRLWDISNDAVGGSHMGHGKVNSETGKYHDLDYNYVYDLITNADIFKPNSDIIVVFAGTNDFNSSPLGQYGDTGTSTFYGALRSVCEYLSAHTEAKVFFVTPIARPTVADASKEENADGEKINAYGATLRDYADAIKRVCAFYQYPVIDLFYEIGWNATNVKPYMDAVGVHPNIKGSKVISQYITGEIKKHFGI